MTYNKKTIEDVNVSGKTVLVRCDFNVPMKDGKITSDKRIIGALPTIKYLLDNDAKVILCSHLGRPKGEFKPEFSLAPVAARLSEYLGKEVKLAQDPEVVGENARAMAAALENELCREILSTKKYTTTPTAEHPEGITISNWFLRRIEDKDTGGEVLCAKTGYVNESGSCAVSYSVADDGTPYICATAGSSSSWRCIYDHVEIYTNYVPDGNA